MCITVDGTAAKIGLKILSGYGDNDETLLGANFLRETL